MHQILEELYRGRLIPQERPMPPTPEFKKAIKELDKLESRLKGKLDEQGLSLLDEYNKTHDDVNAACCQEAFNEGFRLGGRFILALFSENQ